MSFKFISEEDVREMLSGGNRFTITPTYSNVILFTLLKKGSQLLVHIRPDSNKTSIGYCGKIEILDHIHRHDKVDVYETMLKGGVRELNEEVILSSGREFVNDDITIVGMITGGLTCIVAYANVRPDEDARVMEPENKHIGFMTMEDILTRSERPVEPWSKEILMSLADVRPRTSIVLSLENKDKVWKSIPGYSRYMVSSDGEIKNLDTGRISKGGNAGRYLKVSVLKDGATAAHLEYLHILVCKGFKGLPKPGQVVLHCDNDRSNVKPCNLKWGTQSENVQAAYDNGLVAGKGKGK